ncbi:hypothetical protein [Rhodovarius crocodyli]|nr:hypothetical protein [Rhodovarius crocodyli]
MNLLRFALKLDAASCLGMGVLLAAGAGTLAPLLGLPRGLLLGAGIALLPFALFVGWLSTRPSRGLVWLVVAVNALWVLESLAVVVLLHPTALGQAFVLVQAVAVAGTTALQGLGLRRRLA